jgi:hypothetical protein
MGFFSENERRLRENAAQGSLTSVRIEGLEPSPQLTEDLQHWTTGELTLDEVGKRMFERFAQEDRDAGRR